MADAMAQISKSDIAKVESMLSDIKNGATKAMVTAINATAKTTKVQIKKKIGETLAIKAANIEKHLKVNSASYSDVSGSVSSTGKPVSLNEFYTGAQTAKGIKAKVYKSSTPKLLRGAFYATMKSGHEGVFVRKYNTYSGNAILPSSQWRPGKPVKKGFPYGALPKPYRLKIKELEGPRLEDVLSKPEIIDPINETAGELLKTNLGKKVDDILRRHRG